MKHFVRLLLVALVLTTGANAEFTSDELKDVFTKKHEKTEVVPEVLSRIDATLKKFAVWGLNPDGVAVKDFDVQFAVVIGDCPHPKACVPARHYVAFKSNASKRVQVFDVEYIAKFGTYPVAVDLVGLVKRGEE